MKKWFAQAPSNIALIKYMGKLDNKNNVPINASLSYTTDKLMSFVELESHTGKYDLWEPLDLPGAEIFDLDEAAKKRFLDHLQFMKQHYQYEGYFTVRSCNNFPQKCGLASSASSFAALTVCAVRALSELSGQDEPSTEQMAMLSRHASGSSCRSFFKPWALWQGETVEALALPYQNLIHHVVIISHDHKTISSSEAHQRVTTSPFFADRPKQAKQHLEQLLEAFNQQDWQRIYRVCWQEFWEMHQLFKTAKPPFHYMNDDVQHVLNHLQKQWEQQQDGPLITMDAGPNIHLLFRSDQEQLAKQMRQQQFLGNYDVL